MKNFDTRVYSVADFVEWNNNGLLNLSPNFQRRAVWSEKAKSFLIDTIIRGKPVPKILISQELKGGRNLRVVVDGQQRLRAVLGFINGDFKISRAHNDEYAGMTYEMLPDAVRNEFSKYELGVDLLFDLSYEDILDIFSRLNAYTVTLNAQEMFNARYLGYFKQAAYRLGYKYVKYYLASGVLTNNAVARMAEAELSADLLVTLLDAVQTNQNVRHFYEMYEDKAGGIPKASSKFDNVMSYVGAIYPPAELRNTNWSRVQLFYTLFTVIAHGLYGLKGLNKAHRVTVNKKTVSKIRGVLDEISDRYDQISADIENPDAPADYKTFIDQTRRRTTNTDARVARAEFVSKKLVKALA